MIDFAGPFTKSFYLKSRQILSNCYDPKHTKKDNISESALGSSLLKCKAQTSLIICLFLNISSYFLDMSFKTSTRIPAFKFRRTTPGNSACGLFLGWLSDPFKGCQRLLLTSKFVCFGSNLLLSSSHRRAMRQDCTQGLPQIFWRKISGILPPCLIHCFIQKTDLEIASFNNFVVSFKHVLMPAGLDLKKRSESRDRPNNGPA